MGMTRRSLAFPPRARNKAAGGRAGGGDGRGAAPRRPLGPHLRGRGLGGTAGEGEGSLKSSDPERLPQGPGHPPGRCSVLPRRGTQSGHFPPSRGCPSPPRGRAIANSVPSVLGRGGDGRASSVRRAGWSGRPGSLGTAERRVRARRSPGARGISSSRARPSPVCSRRPGVRARDCYPLRRVFSKSGPPIASRSLAAAGTRSPSGVSCPRTHGLCQAWPASSRVAGLWPRHSDSPALGQRRHPGGCSGPGVCRAWAAAERRQGRAARRRAHRERSAPLQHHGQVARRWRAAGPAASLPSPRPAALSGALVLPDCVHPASSKIPSAPLPPASRSPAREVPRR